MYRDPSASELCLGLLVDLEVAGLAGEGDQRAPVLRAVEGVGRVVEHQVAPQLRARIPVLPGRGSGEDAPGLDGSVEVPLADSTFGQHPLDDPAPGTIDDQDEEVGAHVAARG